MQYSEMVVRLAKSGSDINQSMTDFKAELSHMVIGVSGEAGELLDAVKKHVFYNKPLDVENVIEELGDLEFYMEGLRQITGISREQTLIANMEKLEKRYPNFQYSNTAAIDRADKVQLTTTPDSV